MRLRQQESLRMGEAKFINQGNVSISTSGYRIIGNSKVMYDNGPWHHGFKPGQFSNNPVDIRSYDGRCTSSEWVMQPNAYSSWRKLEVTGEFPSLYATPPMGLVSGASADATKLTMALGEAYGKISIPDLDFGMFLAEIGSTVELLKKPLKPLVRNLKDLWAKAADRAYGPPGSLPSRPKKNPKRPRGNLEDRLGNAWLQYRYGVVPLISDVNGILAHLLSPKEHVRGTLERRKSGSGTGLTTSTDTVEAASFVKCRWRNEIYSQTSIHAGVIFLNKYYWKDTNGAGVYDLPSLIYELVPFSFVLDWGYNFGSLIRQMQPKNEVMVMGAYTTVVQENTFHRYPLHAWLNGAPESVAFELRSAGSFDSTLRLMNRIVYPAIPAVAGIYDEIFNIQRSLDSVSLLWQFAPRIFQNKR